MRNNGFTVLELMAYMMILCIFSMLAVPSYKIIGDMRLKADARSLVNDIRYTKDLTNINYKEYKIVFNATGYKIIDPDEKIIKNYQFKKGIILEDYELNSGSKRVDYMSYNLEGNGCTSGSIIISKTDGSKKMNISIVPVTGRVLLKNQ